MEDWATNLDALLDTFDTTKYLTLYRGHQYFREVCAGAKHHHWWVGGLEEHVLQVVNFMVTQLRLYPKAYPGVTATDCVIVAFLHDFDKIWAYVPLTEEDRATGKYSVEQQFKSSNSEFTMLDGTSKMFRLAAELGIVPSQSQWSAILFAHGGYSDANHGYGGLSRTGGTVMHANPLAVLLHMADMFSANLLSKELA